MKTFSAHYKARYGCSVGKIALDLGHVCPNREKGGCIYCYAPSYTPAYLAEQGSIKIQVQRGKRQIARMGHRKYLGYFQQETCTVGDTRALLDIIDILLGDSCCLGVILSTRPDAVDDALLDTLVPRIRKSGKECLFELGLQSSHPRSLEMLNRNHSVDDFVTCVQRISACGCFDIGAHLIFGIPGEDRNDMARTLQFLAELDINAVKLHHLQVLHGTALASLYVQGKVPVMSQKEYFELLVFLIPYIHERMVIHRIWATAHPDMLMAPRWNVPATRLRRDLDTLLRQKEVRQGSFYLE